LKTQTNTLLEFYFGSLEETQRLQIERDLLQDPELVLDYLDLKRKIEGANEVPQKPSPFLWQRLQPKTKKQKWSYAAVAGLVAATVIGFYIFRSAPTDQSALIGDNGILFDSGSEHSVVSDVL
jgi:hypothetical protein